MATWSPEFCRVFQDAYQQTLIGVSVLAAPKNPAETFVRDRLKAYLEAAAGAVHSSFTGLDGKQPAFSRSDLNSLSPDDGFVIFNAVLIALIRMTNCSERQFADFGLRLLSLIIVPTFAAEWYRLNHTLDRADPQQIENALVGEMRHRLPTLGDPMTRMLFVAYFSYHAVLNKRETAEAFARAEQEMSQPEEPKGPAKQKPKESEKKGSWGCGAVISSVLAITMLRALTNSGSQSSSITSPHASTYRGDNSTSTQVTGEIRNSLFQSDALGVSVPVPPNWREMTGAEWTERNQVSRAAVGLGSSPTLEPLFRVCPSDSRGWQAIPVFAAVAIPFRNGGSVDAALSKMRSQVLRQHEGHVTAGRQLTVQTSQRLLTGFEVKTPGDGGGGVMEAYGTIQNDHLLIFCFWAGDAVTAGKLRNLIAGATFR